MITLEEGEIVVFEIRKHWWRIFTWGAGLIFMAVLPFVAIVAFLIFSSTAQEYFYTIGFFYTLWITALWLLFFIEWTDYYLDVWIVTNHRIIDIEQKGLFARDVATVRLEDVHDIKIESVGLAATFFKFGSISVQSSGAHTEFLLRNAKDPEQAKNQIYSYIDTAKKAKYD